MKLCEKCGKEFETEGLRCPSCRKDEKKDSDEMGSQELDAAVKKFPIFILAGVMLTGAGIASALFLNFFAGVGVLLAAEIFCYVPTIMIKKAVKRSYPTLTRLELDEKIKETAKEMKNTCTSYKICRAVALIALAAICGAVFVNV